MHNTVDVLEGWSFFVFCDFQR